MEERAGLNLHWPFINTIKGLDLPASYASSVYELWIGNRIIFGSLGAPFFLFSDPTAHLHHLGHHLSAVEGSAGILSLHHLPHPVRKGHPFATTLKFLLGIFLFLSHFRFLPSWGGSCPLQGLLPLLIRRECQRKGYTLAGCGRVTTPEEMVRGTSATWFCKDRLI